MWIKFNLLALKDIEIIEEYIAQDNPEIANRIVQLIKDCAYGLLDHPNMGRPGRRKNTRELYINGTPYIIPYRVVGETIEILRVLHTSMQWPKKFE